MINDCFHHQRVACGKIRSTADMERPERDDGTRRQHPERLHEESSNEHFEGLLEDATRRLLAARGVEVSLEEKSVLDDVLYQLRSLYVAASR